MPALLLLVGIAVLSAYAVSAFGPPPKPVELSSNSLAQINAQNASTTQAAQAAAASAAQAQATLAALQSGQLYQPPLDPPYTEGISTAQGTVAGGSLAWFGDIAEDGSKVVYDAWGNAFHLYDRS
jgi:hypothetical protein